MTHLESVTHVMDNNPVISTWIKINHQRAAEEPKVMLYLNLIHLGLITLPKDRFSTIAPSHARLGDTAGYTHNDQNG